LVGAGVGKHALMTQRVADARASQGRPPANTPSPGSRWRAVVIAFDVWWRAQRNNQAWSRKWAGADGEEAANW